MITSVGGGVVINGLVYANGLTSRTNTGNGMVVIPAASGTVPASVIQKSQFYNNGQDTTTTRSGIYLSTTGLALNQTVIMTDNTFFDNQGSHTQNIGLNVAAQPTTPSRKLIAIGNDFFAQGGQAINNNCASCWQTLTNNLGYNSQAASSVTAGASTWTYTNSDGYNEFMVLSTPGGISAFTCNTATMGLTAGNTCYLSPGQSMSVTWATTAPVFTKQPT